MQLAVDEFMDGLVQSENGDAPVPEDENFGLYHPLEYVIETWQAYRQFGVLPVMGGYNEQDALLMADWRTLNRRYNLAHHAHKSRAPQMEFNSSRARPLSEF